jgi:hypothetical protein
MPEPVAIVSSSSRLLYFAGFVAARASGLVTWPPALDHRRQ